MSRAMQKKSFAGATMSNAEDFKYDMTLQLDAERGRDASYMKSSLCIMYEEGLCIIYEERSTHHM